MRELRALRADLRALGEEQKTHREVMVDGILERGARFLRAALDETAGRTVIVNETTGRAVSFVGNDTQQPARDEDPPPEGEPHPSR